MARKYIVIWVERKELKDNKYKDIDHYKSFIDENGGENLVNARELYNSKSVEENTYTCNLCEIVKSTDY